MPNPLQCGSAVDPPILFELKKTNDGRRARASFITDEYSQDLRECCNFAKAARLAKVEIRSVWGENICSLSPLRLSEAANILACFGMSVSVIDSFVYKGHIRDQATHSDGLELARRAFDVAGKLKADAVRIFSFWKEGVATLDEVAEPIRRIVDVIEPRDVRLLVENGTFSSTGSGSALAELLDKVDHPLVGALWDPGNVLNGGWCESACDGLQRLGTRIEHVHVKNPLGGAVGSMSFGSLRGGLVNWSEQIAQLDQLDYRGLYSLETHWRSGRPLIGRHSLDFPSGHEFSAGGSVATSSMLTELQDFL